MLQKMRDNSKGTVAGILIGFLVIIFALSGSEALFSNRGNADTVMTVNGEDITELDLARAIEQQRQQYRERFGDAVPEDMLSDENLREPALDTLVRRTLINQVAANNDMHIADERLNRDIVASQAFADAEGNFDPAVYQQRLRMLGYTPGSYKREMERDMTVRQLISGLSGTNFATPEEVNYLLALTGQTRDFNYALLPMESVMDEVEVTPAEIEEYYQANPQQFAEPEKVTVEMIELSVRKLESAEDVSESELRDEYQRYVDAFESSEARRAAHILLDPEDEATIADVQAALDEGEDFAALAQAHSQDPGSSEAGGELGTTTGDAFPEAFEEALRALDEGEVSGPVTTDAGVHFIKLLEVQGAEPESFEDRRDNLARQIRRARAESRFVELLDQLEDLSYNAESLANVADTLGLEVVQSEPFSREGGSGLTAFSSVVEAAFSEEVLEYNNASPVIELAPDRVVVVKKLDFTESYIKPLEEVTDEIESVLREQQARELLAERGDALLAQLRAGTALSALAEDSSLLAEGSSLEVVELSEVSRDNMEHPRSVLELAFSMSRPEADAASVDGTLASGDYVLVELTGVDVPAPEERPEEREAIARSLANMQASAELAAYVDWLEESAEIEE